MPETTYQFLFPKSLPELKLEIMNLCKKIRDKLKTVLISLKEKLDKLLIDLYQKVDGSINSPYLEPLKHFLDQLYSGLIYLIVPVVTVYKTGQKEVLGFDEHCLL